MIGASVEAQLATVLDRLLRGDLGLHELSPSLAGFWHCGWADGRASCEPEIMQLESDRARFYGRAFPEDEWIVRERIGQAIEDAFLEEVGR